MRVNAGDPMMKPDLTNRIIGGTFIAAALMLWLGWMALPVKIGTFFDADVFDRIRGELHLWIWMYRIHLFGLIITAMALTAMAAALTGSPARVLVWPGAMVASAGLVVSALAAAFYYHHGAWGALDLAGKPAEAANAFVDALRVDTEYVTCLVRFGRVFTGLGLVAIACGLLRWRVLPVWVAGVAGLIGLSAMALTMALPDHLSYYQPIFHAGAAWLLATGVVILRSGLIISTDGLPTQ